MEDRRALITGITGQDGSYLASILLARGYDVHGLVRRVAAPVQAERLRRLQALVDRRALTLHQGDLLVGDSVRAVVKAVRPTHVWHLAAQSHVGRSFVDPATTFATNINGTERLLDALLVHARGARVYFAGSSEQFGNQPAPQNEQTPQTPVSPYGESKREAWNVAGDVRGVGLWVARGLAFNHESPRRGDEFVTQKIVQGVVRIARGDVAPFALGNLEARRDWGHAYDYARAMADMLEQPEPLDLVLGTGYSWSVRDWLYRACEELVVEPEAAYVVDPALVRPNEIDELRADDRRAREVLRWSPSYSFGALVTEMVSAEIARQRGDAQWQETLSSSSETLRTTR